MKEKTYLILIIISLLMIDVFILVRFYKLKQHKTITETVSNNQRSTKVDELNTYKANFITNIMNSGLHLESVTIKDSLHNITLLKKAFGSGQEQMLVFRFSQMHCESCVTSSIQILLNWVDSIGINNVMFLGNHRNNRIFNQTIPLYGIKGMKAYNSSAIDIPIENMGYPYYFVLDSNLQISNVFVPDKGLPEITNKYLESIQKKFKSD